MNSALQQVFVQGDGLDASHPPPGKSEERGFASSTKTALPAQEAWQAGSKASAALSLAGATWGSAGAGCKL